MVLEDTDTNVWKQNWGSPLNVLVNATIPIVDHQGTESTPDIFPDTKWGD